MEFYTKYVRPKKNYETNDGTTFVEMQGYEPAKIKIENMILAGKRLQMSRNHQFDFNSMEEIDDNFFDPTRSKSFDMIDASMMLDQVNARLAAQEKEMRIKQKEDTIESGKSIVQSDTDINVSNVNSDVVEDDRPK